MHPEYFKYNLDKLATNYTSIYTQIFPDIDRQTFDGYMDGSITIPHEISEKLRGMVLASKKFIADLKFEAFETKPFAIDYPYYRNDEEFKQIDPDRYALFQGCQRAYENTLHRMRTQFIDFLFKYKVHFCQVRPICLYPENYALWLKENSLENSEESRRAYCAKLGKIRDQKSRLNSLRIEIQERRRSKQSPVCHINNRAEPDLLERIKRHVEENELAEKPSNTRRSRNSYQKRVTADSTSKIAEEMDPAERLKAHMTEVERRSAGKVPTPV